MVGMICFMMDSFVLSSGLAA